MKKILLFIMLFFNIVPYIHQGSIQINGAEKVFAQIQDAGGETEPVKICGGEITRQIIEINATDTIRWVCASTIDCTTRDLIVYDDGRYNPECIYITYWINLSLPGDGSSGGGGGDTGSGGGGSGTIGTEASRAAKRIIVNTKVKLATGHQSGVIDQANAKKNITDVANGNKAQTSNYLNAPGTTTALNQKLLNGIETLAKIYTFEISEIAGGSHTGLQHYYGNAIDVNYVNGVHVNIINMSDAQIIAFRNAAYLTGASLVLDPLNDLYHKTHFHIQW